MIARLVRAVGWLGHYYSTHCLHGHHDQCKNTCKHCDRRCRCSHHRDVDPGAGAHGAS